MKILITGGAGYVGSTLTPLLLAAGHQVRVLDHLAHGGESLLGVWCHPGFEFVRGDIRDRATVRAAVSGRDAVVHLAAVVGDPACARQPDLARATNLDASLALIEESQRAGVGRFIFASTCSNYGKMKDANQYVDEESELSPVSLYAETKVAVETALLSERSQQWLVPDAVAVLHGLRGIAAHALRPDGERIHHGDADQEAPQGFWRAILAPLHTCVGCRPGNSAGSRFAGGKCRRPCV